MSLVVLGSASPRRREILESLGVDHVVVVASVDETVQPGEAPDAYLARVVRAKLAAVRAALSPALRTSARAILVADTSVLVPDTPHARILGKPTDTGDALRMITLLAGRMHEVHTRFALASIADAGHVHEETVSTEVTFRALSRARAEAYVASGEGVDKAGGYAVQGLGGALVSRIAGSYSNVVGLPACEVSVALEALDGA